MIPHPTTPRLSPVPATQWTDEVRTMIERLPTGEGGPLNVFTTLANHPNLMRRWLPYGTALLQGEIPLRDREILILRSAWNCRADYEWGQHEKIGLMCGLSADEIARVAKGPDAAGWDAFDATLLRAADELHSDACLSETTWKALAARYQTKQLVEVPMLVGQYHMLAFALNSIGVQREPGINGLPR